MSRSSESGSPVSPTRRNTVSGKGTISAGNKPDDPLRTIAVVLDVVREAPPEGDGERKFCPVSKRSISVFNLEFEDPCGHAHLMNSLGISIWEGDLEDGEPSLTGNVAMVSRQAVDIFAGDFCAK